MAKLLMRRCLFEQVQYWRSILPQQIYRNTHDVTPAIHNHLPSETLEKHKHVVPITQESDISLLEVKIRNPATTTLAELVKYSSDLQKLISIGVSLREVEEHEGAADLLAKLKYYPHVHDIVSLLSQVGVVKVGEMINKCPFILEEGAENIKLKLMYLSSRKFSRKQIANIVTLQPSWLLESITELDARIGAIQKIFKLSDNDVRKVVSKSPKIVLISPVYHHQYKFIVTTNYEFDEQQARQMVINCPSVTRIGEPQLKFRMDYLLETMKLNADQIISWPSILRCRERRLKERHSVLAHLNMAEYDSTKPGYVSLQRLVSGSDAEFCENVAKIPLQLYYDYLKTF